MVLMLNLKLTAAAYNYSTYPHAIYHISYTAEDLQNQDGTNL